MTAGTIRIGIGGWTFPPWRGVFYPEDLPQKRELEFASRAVTAIEINGTFYGRQSPKSWASWAKAVPDGFRFAVKGSRYCVTRPKLADAGDGVAQFVDQGLVELGDKLGPILWLMAKTRRFDPDDMAAFFALLPTRHEGLALRHVIEVGHESFTDPAFAALAKANNVAVTYLDDEGLPAIDTVTSNFSYARLKNAREAIPTGYPESSFDHWATFARQHAVAGQDAYLFFIGGDKVRNPAAAQALLVALKR